MHIESVETVRVHVPLLHPWITAVRRTDVLETVLVRLRDSDGRTGWGEAAHNPRVTGETTAGIESIIGRDLAPAVCGREPVDLDATCGAVADAVLGNASAKSAVDCAVHDLAARALGVPLHVLLGGVRGAVRTDITLSVGEPDQLGEQAAQRHREGFDVFKVKVDADHRRNLARLRAILDATGPDVLLRVDANQSWTPKQALVAITAMEDAGLPLEFVEQPVAAADVDGLARVTAGVCTPVLADESVRTAADVVTLARRGAADLVNLKLAKCGGLAPARAFLATAAACGLGVVVGSMLESHVACGAAAALAAVGMAGDVVDLDSPGLLRHSPVRGGVTINGPELGLSPTTGTGIDDLSDPITTVTGGDPVPGIATRWEQ